MSYDAIIIGAGLSGLAAGIRLAMYDRKVCILERHTTIGGLNSFYRLDGRQYDVGLHAVTNFRPKGTKKGPLARLLRQLRIGWDEFQLVEQLGSRIAFPGVDLRFTNDLAVLESDIASRFPHQVDGFRRMVAEMKDFDDIELASDGPTAREIIATYINDPLLVEMILCPLLYYGSARENDIDGCQFAILFRSIYCEGLARPADGVKLILKILTRKYKDHGGELRLRAGVRRLHVRDERIEGVELDDGTILESRMVLSSAGRVETARMCGEELPRHTNSAGQLTFVESMSVLDRQPKSFGFDETIIFYNDSEKFHWQRPDGLTDLRSGGISAANNFAFDEPLAEGLVRVTVLANYDRWKTLPREQYEAEKQAAYQQMVEIATRHVPDFRPFVTATDVYSPTTIERFTSHVNGAVYGSPRKSYDGRTHLQNLFLCGTDQGFVGIIGAMVSGLTMANTHCLTEMMRSEAQALPR